jgi:hypothetical protein
MSFAMRYTGFMIKELLMGGLAACSLFGFVAWWLAGASWHALAPLMLLVSILIPSRK